ncbi:YhcN/YlaJ family sporulation lipoprotein [Lentibacillus juripiscarius]|uniref:YhcN/YlaJ family sporulation lipoprotein n=1 Tax=Lentibacillus juripiscarius TaxID=257446 RepID=A0ABW5V7U1_9BACI
MRKLFVALPLIAAFALTGCNGTDNAADEREQIIDELNPENENAPNNSETDDKIGYVRYSKEQIENNTEKDHNVTIDRTKLANMIARIILRNDGFDEVAALVTDEEALIAYAKGDALEADKAADIANKTATSILPGYFDVYVSDNEMIMQDIQSLHNSSTRDDEYDNTIDQIIERMQESPQGRE